MTVYLNHSQPVNLFCVLTAWLFHPAKNSVRVRAHIYLEEDEMNKLRGLVKSRTIVVSLVLIGVLCAVLCGARLLRAQSAAGTTPSPAESALLADFRRVEVASVSDALEQLTGKRMYMSHRMHPISTTKFAGFARTVQLKKDEGNSDPAALNGMLAAIDQGSADSVYVMVVEDGEDIAGMGGLMGTAMAARGYAGAVIDGGVRDVAYLRKIGFPVYATGIVPSTSVHHYRFGGSQIPVTCDGVTVNAGDIIAADSDGVVVVPRAKAQEVLTLAQQMDFKEHSMYAVIEQMKSIVEAVKQFGRL
jgi:regulator of RNase E activity RraA